MPAWNAFERPPAEGHLPFLIEDARGAHAPVCERFAIGSGMKQPSDVFDRKVRALRYESARLPPIAQAFKVPKPAARKSQRRGPGHDSAAIGDLERPYACLF